MTRSNDWAILLDAHDDAAHDENEALLEGEESVPQEVVETLYLLQDAILRYPMVAQAVFSALVAEGRRFARTSEGAELLNRLARSRSAVSARMIWELLTTNGFEERPVHVLPTVFLERFVRALSVRGLEPLVSRLFERRFT